MSNKYLKHLITSISLICLLSLLISCAFTINAPKPNPPVPSPVDSVVVWNADLKPGTLNIKVDNTDVTNQFTVDTTNKQATALLPLSPCSHTMTASGELWTWYAQNYLNTSTQITFQVIGNCTGGKTCQNGACMCPFGFTDCRGTCKDLLEDKQNCGSCGYSCTGGKICQNGTCMCPSGFTDCSGKCKNLDNDKQNCGSCGHICSSAKSCCSGVCKSDAQNCGNCGHVCPQSCSGISGCTDAGTCLNPTTYVYYVEYLDSRCLRETILAQAFDQTEAYNCVVSQYPANNFIVGLASSGGTFSYAVVCSDGIGGHFCNTVENLPALSADDGQKCVQSQWGNCSVTQGRCPSK